MLAPHTVSAVLILVLLVTLTAEAQEAVDKKARTRAEEFLTALAKRDTGALKELYAPKVLVKGGSELLRPRWGLWDGDPLKDAELERDKLLSGYLKLMDKAADRWTDVWSRVRKQGASLAAAQQANQPFAGVRKGDVVLKVNPGPSDDTFYYVWRPDAQGQWQIVAEAADY